MALITVDVVLSDFLILLPLRKQAEKFEEPFALAKVVGTARKKPTLSRFPDNESFAIFAGS